MCIIDYILIFIIIVMIYILILWKRKVRYISSVVDDILNGNLNQRIRFQNRIESLNILSIKINSLIDKFQELNTDKISNEESRKRMISNISHDLRTPLTSMLGYMELIFEDKNLDEIKRNYYLKIIYDKGNHLYNLMEEFFQISKLDSSDINIEIKNINLSELIRQNIIAFFSQIQKLNIEPEINLGKNDFYFSSDEKMINRILNNLINNALKHGKGATKIGIDLSYDSNCVCIEIWDNGEGISDEDINHIFDRLYMADKSRSTIIRNSGLGLSIVKKLVETLHGTIEVQSIPFDKTSFIIKIPVNIK